MLPGAFEASVDELKLSPKSAKKHHIPHSISFPSAQELAANRTTLSVSVSPEASPSMNGPGVTINVQLSVSIQWSTERL